MSKEMLEDLLKSQLSSVVSIHSGPGNSWLELPNSGAEVGYDGSRSLLRLPHFGGVQPTNWKTLNSLFRSRISDTGGLYVVLSFDPSNTEKVIPFLIELIDLVDSTEEDPSEILERVIGNWSNYWIESTPVFDRRDQIGTLGELLVLERLLAINPSRESLESWQAPQMRDDLHDFEGDFGNLEVKTSSIPPRSIYVSSLDQMDHELVSPKSLTIVFVKLNSGSEITLPLVAQRVRSQCIELGISNDFDQMLRDRGYREFEEDDYSELVFDIDSIEQHLVCDTTPIYTNRDIIEQYPAVVSVNQVIRPDQIDFSTISEEDWEGTIHHRMWVG